MSTVAATAAAATTAATTSTGSATAQASANGMISSDFQTFLLMLTTQMQNQDPLNPIESSDYAVQLATFSGVEQQVKTNQLLESLASQMGVMGMSELAGWVGMQARSASPAWYDGASPVTLSPNPVPGADQTVLTVTNADGAEVSRQIITVPTGQIQWDGTGTNGHALPAGLYSFGLESYSGGTLLAADTVETYSRITEAQGTAEGTVLILEGGAHIGTADVTALREGGQRDQIIAPSTTPSARSAAPDRISPSGRSRPLGSGGGSG